MFMKNYQQVIYYLRRNIIFGHLKKNFKKTKATLSKTMRKIFLYATCSIFLFSACAPKISTEVSKSYTPLDANTEVRVFGLDESMPANAEKIGVVKIGDTGFSSNCGWEVVIDKAKTEARNAGGNAVKIVEHISPSTMGSSCHRISAFILKVDKFDSIAPIAKIDSAIANRDYALLHVYRYGGAGALVSYDLHLGDSVICRVTNNSKKTIRIKKDGLNTIWAKTEVKQELPINIKIGNDYYIRCGITMGLMVGRPSIQLVDNMVGEVEYKSIKLKKSAKRDEVTLNDGRVIECVINSEDNNNLNITLFRNGREIKSQIEKSTIKNIQKSE